MSNNTNNPTTSIINEKEVIYEHIDVTVKTNNKEWVFYLLLSLLCFIIFIVIIVVITKQLNERIFYMPRHLYRLVYV